MPYLESFQIVEMFQKKYTYRMTVSQFSWVYCFSPEKNVVAIQAITYYIPKF